MHNILYKNIEPEETKRITTPDETCWLNKNKMRRATNSVRSHKRAYNKSSKTAQAPNSELPIFQKSMLRKYSSLSLNKI